MHSDHEAVKREAKREVAEGFPPCRCDKCEPEESQILIRNLDLLTLKNFEEGLKNPRSLDPCANYNSTRMEVYETEDVKQRSNRKRKTNNLTRLLNDPDLSDLMYELSQVFLDHFNDVYEDDPPFPPTVLFDKRHLYRIIEDLESITTEDFLRKVIGGDPLLGTVKLLFKTISDWKTDSRGEMHYKRVREERRICEENREVTLARLERQQVERVEKQLVEEREETERGLQKTVKAKELYDRSQERLKKRAAAAGRSQNKIEQRKKDK